MSSELTIDDRQQVIADLRAARDEMVRRGRCTGTPLGWQGAGVCAIGALIAAVAPEELCGETATYAALDIPRAAATLRPLHNQLPDGAKSEEIHCESVNEIERLYAIAMYNDDRSTTDEDMFNLFDKALAELGGLA